MKTGPLCQSYHENKGGQLFETRSNDNNNNINNNNNNTDRPGGKTKSDAWKLTHV